MENIDCRIERAEIDKSNQMLANHCGTLPLDFVTNRFPSQSLFMFNVHVHIPTYSHVMCVERVCCVCAFAVHIFIKIAPNRIFPRSKHVAYVRIINLENRMMKKFGSGWKQQQYRVQNNKAMPYMCKLFGILHIIYKQTIDTLVFVLSLSRSPPLCRCRCWYFVSLGAFTYATISNGNNDRFQLCIYIT